MLKVKNIYKTFNKGTINQKNAIVDVSLELKEGDFVTVIGGNGAGKSTLLNLISGMYIIDKGVITIDDNDISKKPEYKRAQYIGRVFQDPMTGTCADMTIEENLAMALRRGKKRTLKWGITKEEKELFKTQLKLLDLGLENRMTSKVGLLSGGQRQALTLLMATITKPRLLLLDEHTAALDPKTAKKVLELTEKLIKENHLTAIMITHNMKDAINYGNRLFMMNDGQLVLDIHEDKKNDLQVSDLLQMFEVATGEEMDNDRMLLG
ncbi:MAG: ATP-binding cassette domain-containing protein [Bacilli bacterium]|nr:ATP-binding cassette domain-containing protein [Bacilli bacterium]